MGDKNIIYTDLIDIKLFGGVFAAEGSNSHLTGPIQFNWGYSLNPVDLVESSTITSSFSGGQGIGKDYRVKYSLLAFAGSVNSLIAEDSKMEEEDLVHFDEVVVKSLFHARTRSKIGQTPRLYVRVEMNGKKFLKDLREYVSLDYNVEEYLVRDLKDIKLNIENLIKYLELNKDNISKIKVWQDDQIALSSDINKLAQNGFNIETFSI